MTWPLGKTGGEGKPVVSSNTGWFDGLLGEVKGKISETVSTIEEKLGVGSKVEYEKRFKEIKPRIDDMTYSMQALANPTPSTDRMTGLKNEIEGLTNLGPNPDYEKALGSLGTITQKLGEYEDLLGTEYLRAQKAYDQSTIGLPRDDPRVVELRRQDQGFYGITKSDDMMSIAIFSYGRLTGEVNKIKTAIAEEKNTLLQDLAGLTDPVRATEPQKKEMGAERKKTTEALKGDYPAPEDFKTARLAISALRGLLRLSASLAGDTAAAAAARQALEKLDVPPEVTDEQLELAKTTATNANKAYEDGKASDSPKLSSDELNVLRTKAEAATREWLELLKQAKEYRQIPEEERERRLLGKQLLTEALTWGPLAADAGRPFPDDQAARFIAAYQKDHVLANTVLHTAKTARHPELLAANIGGLCDRVANGFKASDGQILDEGTSRQYAGRLARMGAETGPVFFEKLNAYLDGGGQFKKDPLGTANFERSNVGTARSRAVAGALLKNDGSIDLTTGKAEEALGHLLFNPDVLENPTPALNRSVLESLETLKNAEVLRKVNETLTDENFEAPRVGGAGHLLVRPLDKGPHDPVTDQETRAAIVSSFLMPVNQGPVGSCFSTAPARAQRRLEPAKTFEAYADMALYGRVNFKEDAGGIFLQVPVVTNLPKGADPLVSSYDYSLATGVACYGNSMQKEQLSTATSRGIKSMKGLFSEDEWRKAKAKLTGKMKGAFTFTYNPNEVLRDATDGSSTRGRYVMVQKSDQKEILTEKDFIASVTAVALKALKCKADSDEGRKIIAHVESQEFIDAVCPDKYRPWELPGGGYEEQVRETMTGKAHDSVEFVGDLASTGVPQTEGERTRDVLSGLLNTFDGNGPELATICFVGHAFNATPNHPSMQNLRDADQSKQDEKIRKTLIEPGQKLKNTELPVEKLQRMFDAEFRRVLRDERDDRLKELIKGAWAKRPTKPMNPSDYSTLLREAFTPYTQDIATTRAKRKMQGSADQTQFQEEKQKIAAELDTYLDKKRKGELAVELGAPEVVIADTNWGDNQSHTMFVLAPDPVSGELIMWKKEEPPGSLSPAGRDFVDRQWRAVTS
jgi:hypothetical protein